MRKTLDKVKTKIKNFFSKKRHTMFTMVVDTDTRELTIEYDNPEMLKASYELSLSGVIHSMLAAQLIDNEQDNEFVRKMQVKHAVMDAFDAVEEDHNNDVLVFRSSQAFSNGDVENEN